MKADDPVERRYVLTAGLSLLAGLPVAAGPTAPENPEIDPEEGVTAPEDLMKEHGVLNRCLLIYEEGLRRLHAGEEVGPEVFGKTAGLVKSFVEEYHEENEERFIFPIFRRVGKLVDLVRTLDRQHRAGRQVTNQIIALSDPTPYRDAANRDKIVAACQSFLRMYRPHEAREDTVLFPAIRAILTPNQVLALGEEMEEAEHRVLGEGGFEHSLADAEAIEKALGIYELEQFTPQV